MWGRGGGKKLLDKLDKIERKKNRRGLMEGLVIMRNTIRRRRGRVKFNDLTVASRELNRRNLNTDPRRPIRVGQRATDTTLARQTYPGTVLMLGFHLPRRETRPIQCKSLLAVLIHSTTS